ncbi:MAG TPA: malate dehydrogenase, partial [Candidatus Cloacimonadota bacterium]|nr:malate dehydrogenase [Candidatus Cloacimonadota bacterium]
DNMAIAAAHSLANYAEKRGIHPDNIVPNMEEAGVFPEEAADVAMQAIKDGVARLSFSREEVFETALSEINQARALMHNMMEQGFIKAPPMEILNEVLQACLNEFKS